MKYKVLRPLFGDHGQAMPGDVIDIGPHLARKYELLEARGVVQRHVERVPFVKKYTVVENKAIQPKSNK